MFNDIVQHSTWGLLARGRTYSEERTRRCIAIECNNLEIPTQWCELGNTWLEFRTPPSCSSVSLASAVPDLHFIAGPVLRSAFGIMDDLGREAT